MGGILRQFHTGVAAPQFRLISHDFLAGFPPPRIVDVGTLHKHSNRALRRLLVSDSNGPKTVLMLGVKAKFLGVFGIKQRQEIKDNRVSSGLMVCWRGKTSSGASGEPPARAPLRSKVREACGGKSPARIRSLARALAGVIKPHP